jgi:hypothetical protein
LIGHVSGNDKEDKCRKKHEKAHAQILAHGRTTFEQFAFIHRHETDEDK